MIKNKPNKILLGIGLYVSFLLIVAFADIILNNESILIYPGDSYEQMFQFYLGGWQRYKELSVTGWDWSLGIGGSFFSYVYYFATSPFFLMSLFLSRDLLKYTFLYFNLLKMFCVFWASYFWLGKIAKNKSSITIGSLIITFSGWVFYFFNYNCFLDAFVFYPLVLAFTEVYLQRGKKFALILTIGLLGIVNYYFLYMFIPFLWMYALSRYIILNSDQQIKGVTLLKEALKFAGYSLLGIGISAVVLFPCADLVLNNQRFLETSIEHLFLGKKDILKIISSLFIPVTNRFNSNVLMDVSSHNSLGWGGGTGIYSLLITPITIFLLALSKNTVKKWVYLSFYAILAIMMSCFPFYRLFQMTIDSRWFYMIVFLNALCCVEIIDSYLLGEVKKSHIRISYFGSTLLFSGIILITKLLHTQQQTKWFYPLIISGYLFLLLYYLWFEFRNKKQVGLLLIAGLECVWCGWVYNENNESIHASFFDNRELSTVAVDVIQEYDNTDGFYRILYGANKEHYDVLENSHDLYLKSDQSVSEEEFIQILKESYLQSYDLFTPNDPFSKNYAGVSFYNTIYSTGAENYLNRFKGNWLMPQNKQRFESYNLLSTKYWFSHYKTMQAPYGYHYVMEKDGVYLYENQYFIDLGFAYEQCVNENEVLAKDVLQQDMIFMDYLVSENCETTLEELGYVSPLIKVGIYPTGSVQTIEFEDYIKNETLYIMNFGLDNLKVRLYSDEKLVFEDRYVQFNYVDFQLLEEMKINRIEFECYDTYGYGNDIYVYRRSLESYQEWYKTVSSRMFTDVKLTKNRIDAQIDVNGNATHVFTSIPYDKGWSVYSDGEKLDIYRVQLGLIGFDLDEGVHQIEFIYETPYLKAGIAVTILSVIVLIILCWKKEIYSVFKQ